MSDKENEMKVISGKYCVVVDTNSVASIQELKSEDSVFEEAKGFISCQWLDHVLCSPICKGVRLEFLVNDNGYADWSKSPDKVNQVATMLYNPAPSDEDGLHYILGNIVMCLEKDTPNGGMFVGMEKSLAEVFARDINRELAPLAKAAIPRPDNVPDPLVKIEAYEDMEELAKAMRGDPSATPSSTIFVNPRQSAEDNQEGDEGCPADRA